MTTIHDRLDRAVSESVNPIPWPAYRAELLALYSPPMVAKSTASKLRAVLKELDALGMETTADLTPVLVSRYIAARPPGQSAHTLHSLLTVIRSICSYAEIAGYVRCSPFRLRKLSRWVRLTPLTGRRHYSRAEIASVLALLAADTESRRGWAQWRARRLRVVVAIIAYTGMRKMECLKLHVQDVDIAARCIWIRPHGDSLKTAASEAPVPIPAALVPILEDWVSHRMDAPDGFPLPESCPWFIPTVNRHAAWISGQPGGKALDKLQAAARRAGITEGMTFKGLRASLATHMEPFAGPALIQRILRHTTVRTSEEHYRKADLPNLVQAMDGFRFD